MKLKANILVLEDEPLIRLMLLSGLEKAGAAVDGAELCETALRMIRDGQFDAALFDYSLPDGKSTDTVRLLRKEGFSIPVVLLSAEPEAISAEMCDELQLSAVLSKPPVIDTLVQTLQQALRRKVLPEDRSGRIGHYHIWRPGQNSGLFLKELDDNAWAAIDCLVPGENPLEESAVEFIRTAGCRAALIGGSLKLRRQLQALNGELVCVEDRAALAALTRRRTGPAERSALLQSVINRNESG